MSWSRSQSWCREAQASSKGLDSAIITCCNLRLLFTLFSTTDMEKWVISPRQCPSGLRPSGLLPVASRLSPGLIPKPVLSAAARVYPRPLEPSGLSQALHSPSQALPEAGITMESTCSKSPWEAATQCRECPPSVFKNSL